MKDNNAQNVIITYSVRLPHGAIVVRAAWLQWPMGLGLRPRLSGSFVSGYSSEHCQTMDTGWCITRYAYLLPQLMPGIHSAWAGSGW